MAKRKKLSQGQQRRVRSNLKKRLNYQKDESKFDDSQLGPAQEGRVISRFGQHADIEDSSGDIFRCNIRRTISSLVTGDRVVWRNAKENDPSQGINGVVEAVHPRQSLLTRPDYYDGIKPVAANIDQIIIVSAVVPEFSSHIIDRYLVASENVEIKPILLLNKIDLLDDASRKSLDQQLQLYQELGYQTLCLSCETGEGLDALHALLKDRTSIFVGQSGVGKSSLINALMPEVEAVTNQVSENSGLGQHTTTTARLYHFPSGGELIDSPGVREFSLWDIPVERITWCFKELREFIGGCKFRDCRHGDDPGCLIRQAVEEGTISQQRYQSYHKILDSMQDQPTRQRPQS
ncbi:small ribosomal subunit biogenesis GTPase RsgA [Dongshaea marina]|uniref:small ribosomal subunit biogenesis GTPase RsgA n=1 Tax=Dongshaea marina TaxID=2047966 RepID=UPI000D3E457C|nr:small ribosomal subunit biogenesis GTPase RsgA [Dongshaea marina]